MKSHLPDPWLGVWVTLLVGALTIPMWVSVGEPAYQGIGLRLAGLYLAFGAYFLAVARARSRALPAGRYLQLLVALSLLVRVLLLPSAPVFSDDIYRYAWDAKVSNSGVNPFMHAPADPALMPLRQGTVWPQINHPEIPTVYPPIAQGIFGLFGRLGAGIFPLKLMAVVFDVGALFALLAILRRRGVEPGRVLLYAWNPLVLNEFAVNGHMDSLVICLLLVALLFYEGRAWARSSLALGLAAGTKLLPLVLWPFWLRRSRRAWLVPLLVLMAYLPFSGAGHKLGQGLGTYASQWQANAPVFGALKVGVGVLTPQSPQQPWIHRERVEQRARWIAALLYLSLIAWLLWRGADPWRATCVLIGAFILLSPTVHPWYVVWIVPFLAVSPSRAFLVFSGLVSLSYLVLLEWLDPVTPLWVESPGILVAEWLPFLLMLAWEARTWSKVDLVKGHC